MQEQFRSGCINFEVIIKAASCCCFLFLFLAINLSRLLNDKSQQVEMCWFQCFFLFFIILIYATGHFCSYRFGTCFAAVKLLKMRGGFLAAWLIILLLLNTHLCRPLQNVGLQLQSVQCGWAASLCLPDQQMCALPCGNSSLHACMYTDFDCLARKEYWHSGDYLMLTADDDGWLIELPRGACVSS